MSIKRSVFILVIILSFITIIVSGFAAYTSYQTHITEEGNRLRESAQSQARLLESIARFDARYSSNFPGSSQLATIVQIRDAHANYRGFGETGEFTLARKQNDQIVFLLSHRHSDLNDPKPVPFDSDYAEPMRRALNGLSGTVIGLDYRGTEVLAAHEPVQLLNFGIVAKIDIEEVREPFLRAFYLTCLIGSAFIALGAFLFLRVTAPWVSTIQDNEARYRAMFNQASVGIARVSPAGEFLEINEEICQILNREKEELLTTHFREITHPDDIENSILLANETLEGKRDNYQIEKRYIDKDGEIIWGNVSVSLVRNSEAEPNYFIAVLENITDRKSTEIALLKREQFINRALNSSLVAIYIYDLESEAIIYINSRYTELTGFELNDLTKLTSDNYSLLYHPNEKSAVDRHLEEIKSSLNGDVMKLEYRFRTKHGNWIWCLAWDSLFERNEKGEVISFIGTFIDITANKEAERALLESEEKYRLAVDATSDGLWDWNILTNRVTYSPAWATIVGEKSIANEYSSWADRIHPADQPRITESLNKHLEGASEIWKEEHRLRDASGDWTWVLGRGRVVERSDDGVPIRMVGTMSDISSAKEAESKIRQAEEQFRLLLNSAAEGIYGIDTKGNCIFANIACMNILGYDSLTEMIGKNMHELIHHTTPDGLPYPVEECQIVKAINKRKGIHVSDEVFWRKDGSSIPIEYWSYPMRKNGDITGSVVTFIDITERKMLESELRHMATHDNLTGLYNRKMLDQRLTEEIHRSQRYQRPLSVFMMDIDHFKLINDDYGHAAGDRVLKSFSSLLKRSIRQHDYVGRYGGEEFVLVLPETTHEDATELAERLRSKIAEHPIEIGTTSVQITASIGVATYPDNSISWEELISAADAAMYNAKNSGRNKVMSAV